MLYLKNNQIEVSKSPHSLGVQNNMTIPSPGFDENPLIIGEKKALAAGLQGCSGLGCLGLSGLMDGTGLLGTGLFVGDSSNWGGMEYLSIALAGWWVIKHLEPHGRHRVNQYN